MYLEADLIRWKAELEKDCALLQKAVVNPALAEVFRDISDAINSNDYALAIKLLDVRDCIYSQLNSKKRKYCYSAPQSKKIFQLNNKKISLYSLINDIYSNCNYLKNANNLPDKEVPQKYAKPFYDEWKKGILFDLEQLSNPNLVATVALKEAIQELKDAVVYDMIDLAAEISAVKGYISGYMETDIFAEDSDANKQILDGGCIYGYLDGLNFSLCMHTKKTPEGFVSISSSGVAETTPDPVCKSLTLDRIRTEWQNIQEEYRKRRNAEIGA